MLKSQMVAEIDNPYILLRMANRPKLYRNCAFPQNFHTRKLSEITVFHTVV